MVRQALPHAVVACVAIFLGGCTVHPTPPVVTVWNKLGIPQACNAAHANFFNRTGNHPQWEKKPPLKRIADPLNFESPNPAIKAAAEIKAEEDLAPQKIKALKYLATIGCGCYDKEGKVEAAILAGLEDCTEDVRRTAAETVLQLAQSCGPCGCCYTSCCTAKIQEKLQDMAYGETDGCWHEPSAEVRAIALQALTACPPIPVDPVEEEILRETVPTPPVPSPRETAPPEAGQPLPPIPPPAPMETSAPAPRQEPVLQKTESIQLTTANSALPQQAGAMSAPIFVYDEDLAASDSPRTQSMQINTKVELVLDRQSVAVLHLPKTAAVEAGETLSIQIHSRRGEHTIDGQVAVVKVENGLAHVRPVDGLALRTLRPGSDVTISR